MAQSFIKDPQEELDYTVDWSDWLDADTISTSSWDAADGIDIENESDTATTATVWLSGGTVGTSYRVTNTIVTAAGRTGERTITVKVTTR